MKWVLIILIRLYWFVVPIRFKRVCLFKESCSNYIYKLTLTDGFLTGFEGLRKRMRQCRGEYHLRTYKNGFEMLLSDGSIINQEEISITLIEPYINSVKNFENSLSR